MHPIPLSEVKAIRKHAPSFGTQHLVLVLSNGLTLPPLYFTNGGVKGLFSALREVRPFRPAACEIRIDIGRIKACGPLSVKLMEF